MSTLITVGLRSFQRSLPCGGSRGIRGRGFAIFVSKKLTLNVSQRNLNNASN